MKRSKAKGKLNEGFFRPGNSFGKSSNFFAHNVHSFSLPHSFSHLFDNSGENFIVSMPAFVASCRLRPTFFLFVCSFLFFFFSFLSSQRTSSSRAASAVCSCLRASSSRHSDSASVSMPAQRRSVLDAHGLGAVWATPTAMTSAALKKGILLPERRVQRLFSCYGWLANNECGARSELALK